MDMLFGKLNNEYLKGKQQEKTVTPTTEDIIVEPDLGYDGLSQVTVVGDADLVPNNIVKGVDIFGVVGTQEIGVFPSGNQDITTLDEYDVYNKATARVSSNERAKIIPENIVEGVSILGVDGTAKSGTITGGYTVTFIVNGSEYAIMSVVAGDSVVKPSDPDIIGYYFDGWFTQPNGAGTKVKFPYTPVANTTIYAWTPQRLPYLKFSSSEPFSIIMDGAQKRWDGDIQYSTDLSTWSTWGGEGIGSSTGSGECTLYLRGIGNTKLNSSSVSSGISFMSGSNVSCEGDIESLFDYSLFMNNQSHVMADYACYRLFCPASGYQGNVLVATPRLSAKQLSQYCYWGMFYGCSSIVTPPALPATTIANGCYGNMFYNCTSLISAPALPARELVNNCYASMFQNCSSLEEIIELPTTGIPSGAYSQMFSNCLKIKLSRQQIDEYVIPYRLPTIGMGVAVDFGIQNMFVNTGGSFTGTPVVNSIYYTSNNVVSAND